MIHAMGMYVSRMYVWVALRNVLCIWQWLNGQWEVFFSSISNAFSRQAPKEAYLTAYRVAADKNTDNFGQVVGQ